jgi:hypothetical protein
MKQKTIHLRDHEVRSALAGELRQVRRRINAPTDAVPVAQVFDPHELILDAPDGKPHIVRVPFGPPGTVLIGKEAWQQVHPLAIASERFSMPGTAGIPGPPKVVYRVIYRADGPYPKLYTIGGLPHPYAKTEPFDDAREEHWGWVRAQYMPPDYARIRLVNRGVRVERGESGWEWVVDVEVER